MENIPVFLDAPLAIKVTKVFKKFPNLLNEDVQKVISNGSDPFNFKELKNTLLKDESIKINEIPSPKIIIAGSGMCEGGRVKYHLIRYLQNPKNLLMFIGYQVKGTLGRRILESSHGDEILIDDIPIKINSDIKVIDGFSAHADQKELVDFVRDFKNIYCIYLIHGDEDRKEAFKKRLNKELESKVHIVKKKERIYI